MTTAINAKANPALQEVVRRLVELFEPERIYLFGSQARGDASGDSDYDVMVVVPESDQPSYRRAQKAYSVLWGVGIPVEVIVFTREQFDRQSSVVASLAATVQREGRILYEH
ncbi:MAG: nucleotidyltransferase domain-containing protein [Sphaerobacteraceae bacterium]|nr:MAG: nucleotidyltransferase domain-containing protein [Sphaerobacteraceae bacterium]